VSARDKQAAGGSTPSCTQAIQRLSGLVGCNIHGRETVVVRAGDVKRPGGLHCAETLADHMCTAASLRLPAHAAAEACRTLRRHIGNNKFSIFSDTQSTIITQQPRTPGVPS
jgi:hypothetical protein